ncbi:dienelactone hydrolase family protein [Ottowia thiooxydans]|uniref:dienelactone hydrolase family protein n=1 Tax=Ottowia thiooxydans TaxID=219182 RepID=UPI0003FEDE63|nr:dienelactone hydrolase family protein [Ottowia thiooxydans]
MRLHPRYDQIAALVTLWLTAALMPAHAQDLRAQLGASIDLKPVTFAAEAKDSIGIFTDVANTVFKPAGEGPFPATVLMHTCGGLKGAPNVHMKRHAQSLLAAGHVVLVVDSFGPRGFDDCRARTPTSSTGIADAYAALAFLASKPFVDKARIYQVGYSWGAFMSALLASPQSAQLVGSEARFAATVANYGSCAYKNYTLLLKDIDRPVLMLLAGRDTEVPPSPCFPLLDEMKAAGKPVQWHVFPNATHGWDKPGLTSLGYTYDPQITQDATARLLAFLAEAR